MSMLAEPRRKQKWSVDPRNSAWSKDDSKFGQKMLERMGWSKGKGLGRSEQGSTDHVKVKVKNDSYGLGANASHEDKWIAHQDDFNELLAQLNHHHGQNTSTEPPTQEEKGFSLEEKSKMSRKRVHYTKFTKGKDLSSRTETDLNCIFGKRARPAKDREQESNSCDSRSSDADDTSTPATPELDAESTTKTVTSALTMQEYFAQRMSQLKRACGQAQSKAPIAEVEGIETSHPSEEPGSIHSGNDDSEEPRKKKKKKKKATEELEVTEKKTSAPNVIEDDGAQQQEHLGKKKKKRKIVENGGATNEMCGATSGVEQNCEELPPSKKKKERKKHEETVLLNTHRPIEDQVVDSEVVHKKKKKSGEVVDNVVKVDKVELIERKFKKDKKKKKHQK